MQLSGLAHSVRFLWRKKTNKKKNSFLAPVTNNMNTGSQQTIMRKILWILLFFFIFGENFDKLKQQRKRTSWHSLDTALSYPGMPQTK